MKFIGFSLQLKQQLAFSTESAFVPAIASALVGAPDTVKHWQPDMINGKQIVQGDKWLVEKTGRLQLRYVEFMLI